MVFFFQLRSPLFPILGLLTSVRGGWIPNFGWMSYAVGPDCLKAPFGKQLLPPVNWVKSEFLSIPRNGFQVVKKVGFDPLLHPQKPTFDPLLDPFQDTETHLKPT